MELGVIILMLKHFIDSNGKLGFPFLCTKKSFEYFPWKYKGVGSDEEYAF